MQVIDDNFFYSLLFIKKEQCNIFSSLYLSLMLLEITSYCDLVITYASFYGQN